MLLDTTIAQDVLDAAQELGASFADIFVERDHRQSASVLDSKVHRINTGIDFGVGVRLIFPVNGSYEVFYGYTNTANREELLGLVTKLGAYRARKTDHPNAVALKPLLQKQSEHSPKEFAPSLEFLVAIDREARRLGQNIAQVDAGVLQRVQEVEIYNTEGLAVRDIRPYLRFSLNVIAEKEGERSSGFFGPGVLGDLQNYQLQHTPEKLAQKAVTSAMATLKAPSCPAGKMPVVLAGGFGGVIFHEACGHLLETTSVQKKASVFHDKLGEMIANPVVSAVDDGTIEAQWGSITFDDEGLPTKKTQLIKDGKLTHFIVDRVGELKTGHQVTGSGRRQNYRFAPASRMRNTYIEAGQDKFEDMIASIDEGLYCQSLGGGSVSPGTGEFNFAAVESYKIEKGKITTPVKGATLIGTGPDILKRISMVGPDLELATGMCGSVSGAVPVTVGQPPLKIDEILVGGTK